jgi:hypothetical protein
VFWRYLKQMADARKIQRIIEESQYPNNATHLYRLPQRRRETVQHRNRI